MSEASTKILCNKLDPAEHDKIECLASLIAERLLGVQVCEAVGSGADRFLHFYGLAGFIGSVHAEDFLAASARDGVDLIAVAAE